MGYGIMHGRSCAGVDAGGSSARRVDRRASESDLRARTRCGRVCLVGVEQAIGRGAQSPSDAQHALGHDSRLRKTAGEVAEEATGGENRPSRQSATRAGSDRSAGNAQAAVLSRLRRSLEADRRHPHALYRRHPGNSTGSDRAHDPQRLVLEVPETRRAESARRLAECDAGQSRPGAFGLAALCVGQHAFSDRGSFQLSPATEGHARRSGADVVSIAGDPLRLVRRDSTGSVELGGAARRRNRLARGRQNTLAVVLHNAEFDLLT